jgi:hypothetical protein
LKLCRPISNFGAEFIAGIFITLFIYAASSKVLEFDKFRIQISQSPLLTAFGDWIAWFVITIETLTVVFLSVRRLRIIGLYSSFGLMVAFAAYIIAIIKFSEFIPCSCGGILEHMSWNTHLIFNLVFVVLATIGVFLETNKIQIRKSDNLLTDHSK